MKTVSKVFLHTAVSVGAALAVAAAQAQIVRIDESAFTAQAGNITFSEFAGGTQNPTYAPADYGGGARRASLPEYTGAGSRIADNAVPITAVPPHANPG